MCRSAVVLESGVTGQFQRELTDLGTPHVVVGPGGLGYVAVRKAALVGHDLLQGAKYASYR